MYKIIALDMDETLLTSDKQISPKTVDTLLKAHNQGVKIVLASGRPHAGLITYLKQLNIYNDNEYVLCFNGALVVHAKSGKPISTCILKGRDYKRIFKLAQEFNVHCHAFSTRQGLITDRPSQYTQLESDINHIDINYINPLTDIDDDEDIIKVMFIDPPEIIGKIEIPEEFKQDYNTFRSSPFFIEFTNKGVDKGAGLKHLADYLGIKQEETMACGDQGNDLAMIKYAGLGVAMGNAIDSVKAVANYITDTNDNDGVAKAVEKFVLK